MQEETSRHKEEESRRNREISKLRKESRKQLNQIKSLQAQSAARDQVSSIIFANIAWTLLRSFNFRFSKDVLKKLLHYVKDNVVC